MRKHWNNLIHGTAGNESASGKQKSRAVLAGSLSAPPANVHKGQSAARPAPPASKQRSKSSSVFRRPAWRMRFGWKLAKARSPSITERAPLPLSPTGLVKMTPALQQWRTDYVDPQYRTQADNAGRKSRKAQRAERMFCAMEEYTRREDERRKQEIREQEAREREERIDAIVDACRPGPLPAKQQTSLPRSSESRRASSGRYSDYEDHANSPYDRRVSERPSRISDMPSGPTPIVMKRIQRLPNSIDWDWKKQDHPRPRA